MNPPSAGRYSEPPDNIYVGDAWAGGSGIVLSVLGCACGLPTVIDNPALKSNPGILPMVYIFTIGCGGLSLFLDYMVIRGRKWAMIVTLVLLGIGLLGILASLGNRTPTSTPTIATPLQYLRILILLFYIPLRLGRAFGPELR